MAASEEVEDAASEVEAVEEAASELEEVEEAASEVEVEETASEVEEATSEEVAEVLAEEDPEGVKSGIVEPLEPVALIATPRSPEALPSVEKMYLLSEATPTKPLLPLYFK